MHPIGSSPQWKNVMLRVSRVAPLPAAVLITGETGTGKELVARAIHDASGRPGKFVAVNCAMLSRELAEARLFGVTKGAYTGADRSRYGLIQASNGGTLFLDEVGELPAEVQAMLLRVLQDKVVSRMGGQDDEVIDFRLVTATHQPVEHMDGFRRDFFERVAEYRLQLPPLRARGKDVVELARHILATDPSLVRLNPTLHRSGEVALQAHHWPGNVRELATCLRTLAIDGLPLTDATIRRYLEGELQQEVEAPPAPTPAASPAASPVSGLVHLIKLLEKPASTSWLATELGVSTRTCLRYLKALIEQGKVEVLGSGRETLYRSLARSPAQDMPPALPELEHRQAEACAPALELEPSAQLLERHQAEACAPVLELEPSAHLLERHQAEACALALELEPSGQAMPPRTHARPGSRLKHMSDLLAVSRVRQAIGGYG